MENFPIEQNLSPDNNSSPASKKRIIIFVIAIVAIIIGLILLVIFFSRNKKQPAASIVADDKNTITETSPSAAKLAPSAKSAEEAIEQAISNTAKVDKDFDGILDGDEAKYGTSPTSSDSDSDGLTDWAEINTFQTDPLKSDTDGDGYKDGEEVSRGYNPAGK